MYEKLVQYKSQFGDCKVPQDYKGVRKLGRWVKEQRFTKDRLPAERVAKLEAIGFVWCPHSKLWDEMYDRMVAYQQTHGDCLVPRRYKKDAKLGAWVYTQRYARKNLSPERINQLESIGFVWRVKRASAPSKKQKLEKNVVVVKDEPKSNDTVKPKLPTVTKFASHKQASSATENDSLASLIAGALRVYTTTGIV